MHVPAWIETVVFLLTLFVVIPTIIIAIGYAAWAGKPRNWDRSMYWTAFAASMVASAFLFVYAQRMQSDVGTWRYPAQMALMGLCFLLFGVAGGCMVGILTYGRAKGPIWRQVTPRSEHSMDKGGDDHKAGT